MTNARPAPRRLSDGGQGMKRRGKWSEGRASRCRSTPGRHGRMSTQPPRGVGACCEGAKQRARGGQAHIPHPFSQLWSNFGRASCREERTISTRAISYALTPCFPFIFLLITTYCKL